MAEEFIAANSKKVLRDFEFRLEEWIKKANAAFVPICITCVTRDFKNNELNDDWHYYTSLRKGFITQKREIPIMSPTDNTKLSEMMVDYVCEDNHGISKSFLPHDWERLTKKDVKEEKSK